MAGAIEEAIRSVVSSLLGGLSAFNRRWLLRVGTQAFSYRQSWLCDVLTSSSLTQTWVIAMMTPRSSGPNCRQVLVMQTLGGGQVCTSPLKPPLSSIGAARKATDAAPNESDSEIRLDAFQPPSTDMLASAFSLLLPIAGVESTPISRGSR